jgi:hypothetical protein
MDLKKGLSLALVVSSLSLGACSTIVDGTSQEIVINTNPSGADCGVERKGTNIARVNPTPGAALVSKTKEDITIRCNKDGYDETTYINKSGNAKATLGNILLGGVVGWGIDSATGADNKYTSPVNITLTPKK